MSSGTDIVRVAETQDGGAQLGCGDTPPEPSLLDAALDYASRGWRVLPLHNPGGGRRCSCGRDDCSSPAKHPRTERGVKDATAEEETIQRWWRQNPSANVGIATGSVSGIAVLDIDPRNGGDETLEALESQHGRLPQTTVVQTGGGGRHFYFVIDGPVRSTKLGPGVDLKADGGYVVAPPSLHASGAVYRGDDAFDDGVPLADLPEWVRVTKPAAAIAPMADEHGEEREAFGEGERNQQLTGVGGLLRRQGLTASAIEEELRRFNTSRCAPPLEETEVQQIAESVARYPVGRRDETHSAAYRDGGVAERKKLTFRTAKEIAEATPEEPDWIARPWVAAGAITESTGRAKTAGKTTFCAYLIRSVLDGQSFLGQPTQQTQVVYLTEEKDGTLKEALRRVNLLEREDLHFLSWHESRKHPWSQVVQSAVQKCVEVGAKMLVVDTLPQFAGFKGDQENNTGDALEALKPLQEAAAQGIGVVVIRHERKSGGDVGQAGRGSSAFAGAMDILMSTSRQGEGGKDDGIRVIKALARFDETPEQVTVKLTKDGYEVLSWGHQTAVERAMEGILDALEATSEAGVGLKLDEFGEAVTGSRTTLQDALTRLQDEGTIEQHGKGVRGDPRRYRRANVSADPATPIAAERNSQGSDLQEGS